MAFTDVHTGIEIKKYGTSVGSDYATEITGFKEDATTRKINYTKVVGGLILANIENTISKTVSFDFVIEDFEIIQILEGNAGSSTISNFDIDSTNDKYKIALKFTNGTDYYNRFYYNAYVEEFTHSMDDGVLMGNIIFSIPMKNINGNSNYYISEQEYSIASGSLDTLMGY